MRFFLEYYALKSLLLFTKLLPNAYVYRLCKVIARLFFRYGKRRSTLTVKNLHLAYPEKSDAQIHELAQKSFDSLSITIAEILLLFNEKIALDAIIESGDETLALLKQYTQTSQEGAIIITAHFSNWEIGAHFLAKNGLSMAVIGRRGNNPLIEQHITTPFREKFGDYNIYKDQAAAGMIKCLKKKERVGLMIDQKAGGANSVKVKFFNHEADTINSIATLKLKYNPLILPMFGIRLPNGKYKILVHEPVAYVAKDEENKQMRIHKITQHYNDILESVVRAYPEQWFWMHDRWRIAK